LGVSNAVIPLTDVEPDADPTPAALRAFMADMQMLAAIGGRERTREEYDQLLNEAGFRLESARELAAPFWLLAAHPA
jgi:hypothetical protein